MIQDPFPDRGPDGEEATRTARRTKTTARAGTGGPGSGPPGGTSPGGRAGRGPGTGPGVAALVNITVPLATALGQSGTPADVAGYGLVDAGTRGTCWPPRPGTRPAARRNPGGRPGRPAGPGGPDRPRRV
ncbi:MAG TPA: hypothetical protein VME19_14005 [Streptosporangiaceae bacterium]|nr:hypothetical protein [Streptosporangiaceae bacterium]